MVYSIEMGSDCHCNCLSGYSVRVHVCVCVYINGIIL